MVPYPSEKYYRMITGGFKNDKYEDDLISSITFAVKYFFPKWKGFMLGKDLPAISCKESLQCVDSIHRGFWTSYGDRFKYWKHDYGSFKRYIGEVLTLFLFDTFSLKVIHFPWHGCHLGGQNGKFKACKNQIIVAKIFPNAILYVTNRDGTIYQNINKLNLMCLIL